MTTAKTYRFSYADGSRELEAFVAYPSSPIVLPTPVVLVAHAWYGQDSFAREQAEMLAGLGYIGMALDVYGKGRHGSTAEEGSALMTPWVKDRAALRTRLMAAVMTARELEGADAARVGVIGFCFGGLCALDLARANAPGVKAVVAFHGLFFPPDLGHQGPITARILALHGYDDPMAKPELMVSFMNELTAAQADWQLHAYGSTSHAFTNPAANDADHGLVFRPQSATRAFQAMENFLRETL